MAKNNTPEYDLTFVAPQRREEVLRRIRALERYINDPRGEVALEGARELGLHRRQFYYLVKVWRESRKPEKIFTARRAKDPYLKSPIEIQDIIRRAAAELPTASPRQVWLRASEIAKEAGLKMVTESTARRFVRMLRRQIDTNDPVSSSIVIDQCAIDISTPATDGGRTMPIATLVIDPVAHRVLGLALSLNISPKYVARALVDALLQTGPHTAGQEPTIKLNVTANIAWRKLSEICVSSGTALEKRIKKQIIGGDWTSKLIGQRLADFHLRPKMTRFTENLRLPTKIEMSLAEAEELLRARIHADAPHESAFSSMPELQRMELLRKLAGFAL